MIKIYSFLLIALISGGYFLSGCKGKTSDTTTATSQPVIAEQADFGGYPTQAKWGEHLVTILGCNDCHTPKKMTAEGPVLDSSLLLSGHSSQVPVVVVDRVQAQKIGMVATNDLTSWVGPWGISYAANLTSDPTGMGNWTPDRFIYAMRKGAFMGMPNTRSILPPMPWQDFAAMTDGELKAIFAYLLTTHPVDNNVPAPEPPAGAH